MGGRCEEPDEVSSMKMKTARTLILILALLVAAAPAFSKDNANSKGNAKQPAQKPTKEQGDAKGKGEAKELSGISIVGNKEAPKSLFIVPWKSSELGVETGLASSLLNEDLKPVDKEVFERELEFYSITAVE